MNKITKLLSVSLLGLALCACGETSQTEPEQLKNEDGYVYVIEKEYEPDVLPLDSLGGIYTGFINEQGLPAGHGKMEYASSTVYDGDWIDGYWNGKCKINWDSGCIYFGEARESQMHGRGYMKWTMGDYYYGDWKFGSPNGFGTKYYMVDMTAEDDMFAYNVYTGNMVDNLKSGKGTMHYSFGAIYDGDWENDVRQGYGVQFWESGCNESRFEGEFQNDWISGHGTMYYTDGTVVTGTWEGTTLIAED